MKAVKRQQTHNAYERKLEGFVKTITEAAKAQSVDSNVGIAINVFQETSVNLARGASPITDSFLCSRFFKLCHDPNTGFHIKTCMYVCRKCVIHDSTSSLKLRRADYTVLLSVASCQQTWNLFQRARKEKLVHLAITG